MTSAEKSFIGIAEQSAKGTPNTTDGDFIYLLFRTGGMAPQNIVIPLDPEVGGGAMLRDMVKVGVTSGGALDLIPRPASLGRFLKGAIGDIPDSRPYNLVEVLAKEAMTEVGGEASGAKTSPPVPMELVVTGYPIAGLTGTVEITGTDIEEAALTDIPFVLDGSKSVLNVAHTIFKTVTSVKLPGWTTDGDEVSVGYVSGAYKHIFTLPADQFSAPYWTVRSAPGNLLGEQFQDCRVAGLALTFAGARYVEGAVTFMGGLPAVVATTNWDAAAKVDGGPQFLSPLGDIELPLATNLKVLSGSVAFGLAIPLDEQWIVGSYTPDDFDINQRSVVFTYNIKLTDADLYKKMMYDPAAGDAWLASLWEEGNIKLYFASPDVASTLYPAGLTYYSLDIKANATHDNIVWSAAPVGLRAGRQIVMAVTGLMTNVTAANQEPITVTLVNATASYPNTAP